MFRATTRWRGWCWRSAGALLVGNVAAIIRPPAEPLGVSTPSSGRQVARSAVMAAIGLLATVWALAR